MTVEGLRITINKQFVRIFVFCVRIYMYGFIRIFIFSENNLATLEQLATFVLASKDYAS